MPKRAPRFDFGLGVSHDTQTGEILAVYFRIRKGKAARVVEIADGKAFANYDKDGNLLGLELLEPCSVRALDKIASAEPVSSRNRVKQFFKKSAPREMVLS